MATPPTKTTKSAEAKAPPRRRTPAKPTAPKASAKTSETKSDAAKAAAPKAAAPKAKSTRAAAKPGTPRKPRAVPTPKTPAAQARAAIAAVPAAAKQGVETAKAAVASVPKTARKTVDRAKAAVSAVPVPEVTPTQTKIIGGVLAAAGVALVLWRATKADQPEYTLVERDGAFEIREYPALVTAGTEARGPRNAALDRGFGVLADYIFAKSRSGEKLAMTAPVLSDKAGEAWRTRFIMPAGKARSDLPSAPAGVTLENVSPRRVAAVRFAGRADDALLETKEGALRSWLQLKNLPSEAKAEYGFYNSPMMPGPLRRNEVLVTLSEG